MYVAGIDCSWFRTPFLKHRFLVQAAEQIERLRRSNIHTVDIDPSKGLDLTSFPIAEETLHTIGLHTSTQSLPAHDAPRSLGTLSQELTMARETCDKLAHQDQGRSTKPYRKSSSSHEPSAPTPHSWR
jgi:hypothetical protein